MASDLQGAELDRAVAVAMGWTISRSGQSPSRLCWWEKGNFTLPDPPGFSTDWGLVPKMLAWLRERCVKQTGLEAVWDEETTVESWHCFAEPEGHRDLVCRFGETLPIALARLVVAVAEMGEEAR